MDSQEQEQNPENPDEQTVTTEEPVEQLVETQELGDSGDANQAASEPYSSESEEVAE